MSDRKHLAWLYDHLPDWQAQGWLAPGAWDAIRDHYGPVTPGRGRAIAIACFGVAGAALIALGIILVLASNWAQLGRPMRTVVAFLPVVAGLGLCALTLLRFPDSAAWREGSSVFLIGGLGACIALIGQTYHVDSSMAGFLLVWFVLSLPLAWVMPAVLPQLAALAMLPGWCAAAQFEHGHALAGWFLVLPLVGSVAWAIRRQPHGPAPVWLALGSAICLPIVLGFFLERTLPGLWIVAYPALFAVFLLAGQEGDDAAAWTIPLRLVGGAGLLILGLVYTFDGPWRSIGWSYWHHDRWGFHRLGYISDGAVALALLVPFAVLGVRVTRTRDLPRIWLASLVLTATVGFALASAVHHDLAELAVLGLHNLWLFGAGVLFVVIGARSARLRWVNVGMLTLVAWIAARFFDSDFGLLERGLAFIVLGGLFLGGNLATLAYKKRRREAA